MTVAEIDAILGGWFSLGQWSRTDRSMNGLQVGRGERQVKKIASAVDACQETFRRAAEQQADMLLVHHGLFWGAPIAVTGAHYERVRFLIENDIALYAIHLPLDEHVRLGNNAVIASELGMEDCKPFGNYRGISVGIQGRLPKAQPLEAIVKQLFGGREHTLKVLPFGPDLIESIGIISGGAPREVAQAIDEGLDLYITGDASHEVYHMVQEAGINVIFGGHYSTEIWGVRAAGEEFAKEYGLEHVFIDVPTGL
ncbi:MAG: Nif3-like dinuclear metal center hexameric protein [Spirochaetaceae bacterium]|nr:MAG: Nif3-like dinuclear metal center hexameric protein [Spirochaetaceae bacterium]